jgi:S-adenosyl-L-methionine hydrolase (adenosine-forming)
MAVITLLTDFGNRDEYVGVMKGVILSIASDACLVDITHEIDPMDMVQGAYILAAAVNYFPKKSIHLAVVDPGVGSARAAVAVRCGRHTFVAPDNGILSLVLSEKKIDVAVRIENEAVFQKPVSPTFHGRDIFAPAAAFLYAGGIMEKLGPTIPAEGLVRFPQEMMEHQFKDRLEGRVVAIDRFGNLMTNITAQTLDAFRSQYRTIGIWIGNTCISTITKTYSKVGENHPLALIGSRGYLEISVNQANAGKQLNVLKGDRVVVAPL